MKIAVIKETRQFEERVSCTPEIAKKLIGIGFKVSIESNAGLASSYNDEDYKKVGVEIVKTQKSLLSSAEIVFAVIRPELKVVKSLKKGTILICQMEFHFNTDEIKEFAKIGITSFALELVPRISRAQSMDVLSSQSNLAGYRAVIEASQIYRKAFPMMMTAAGTIPPARVLVMGAGVAGLQAIATAKRMGAIVSATDVRPAAKEQVESLGGKFVAVEDDEFRDAESSGGYAKQMSASYQKKQSELVAKTISNQDIVITTALIPGKPAPKLISDEMVKSMKPGSVIVDLAAVAGGNCSATKADQINVKNKVSIVGFTNIPSRLAGDASRLFARNIYSFIENIWDKEKTKIKIDQEDEIVKGTLLTDSGKLLLKIKLN